MLFRSAGNDIKVFGGGNHADNVTIRNVFLRHSAANAIHIGKGIEAAKVERIFAEAINGSTVVEFAGDHVEISEIHAKGFKLPVLQEGKNNGHLV